MRLIALARWILGLILLAVVPVYKSSHITASLLVFFAIIIIPSTSRMIKKIFKVNFDDYLIVLIMLGWGAYTVLNKFIRATFLNVVVGTYLITKFIIKSVTCKFKNCKA